MSRLQQLPSDQTAVLELLLRQRKSYGEIASMLAISETAVRERAYAAIRELGAREGTSLMRSQREELADFLLGQRDTVSASTSSYLQAFANARSWAEEIRVQLQEISPVELPPLPPAADTATVAPAPPAAPTADGGGEQTAAAARAEDSPPSAVVSRRGGALLLAAMLAAIIVAVVLIVNSGGSGKPASSVPASTPTATQSSPSSSGINVENQLKLSSPIGGQAKAIVAVASQGSRRAFIIVAEHLAPTNGFFYVAWLYNSRHDAEPVGKAPKVGADGRLQAAAPLPPNASRFHRLILTRETDEHPSEPGQIVLTGAFSIRSKKP